MPSTREFIVPEKITTINILDIEQDHGVYYCPSRMELSAYAAVFEPEAIACPLLSEGRVFDLYRTK